VFKTTVQHYYPSRDEFSSIFRFRTTFFYEKTKVKIDQLSLHSQLFIETIHKHKELLLFFATLLDQAIWCISGQPAVCRIVHWEIYEGSGIPEFIIFICVLYSNSSADKKYSKYILSGSDSLG
jgi:hypothetical protein